MIKGILFVKLTDPDAGHDGQKESVKDLVPGIFYPVHDLEMGQSSTSFKIESFPRKSFNSVHFTFYERVGNVMKEVNIYNSPKYNPYLSPDSVYYHMVREK